MQGYVQEVNEPQSLAASRPRWSLRIARLSRSSLGSNSTVLKFLPDPLRASIQRAVAEVWTCYCDQIDMVDRRSASLLAVLQEKSGSWLQCLPSLAGLLHVVKAYSLDSHAARTIANQHSKPRVNLLRVLSGSIETARPRASCRCALHPAATFSAIAVKPAD